MNLIKHIKSNQFALWVAILSVIVQSFHSYTAFYSTSSLQGTIWGIIQAIGFAAVVDLAILFYTVRGRRDIALMAAFAMVIINSYYYYQHWHFAFEFWFGAFLALIIPASVYFYSEEIDDVDDNHLLKLLAEQKDIIGNGKAENKRLRDMLDDHREKAKKELYDVINEKGKEIEDLIHWRDTYKESSELLTKEIYRLTKAESNVGNYSKDIEEVQDKSLLNVTNDPEQFEKVEGLIQRKNPGIISTDKPVTE